MGLFEREVDGAGVNLGCGGGVGASKTLPFFSPSSMSYSSRFLSSDILIRSTRCPPESQTVTGNRSRSIDNSGQLTVSTGTPVKYVPEGCLKGALSDVNWLSAEIAETIWKSTKLGCGLGMAKLFLTCLRV